MKGAQSIQYVVFLEWASEFVLSRICSQGCVYDSFVDQSTSIDIHFIVKENPKVIDYCYCSSSTMASRVVRAARLFIERTHRVFENR